MSAGVRNLRAMFETQRASSSTEEPRGRSPVGSAATAAADSTARPTPPVRASFVPVEPSIAVVADLGTSKGTAVNSAAAHRRESFSVSQDHADELAELKKAVTEEKEERKNSLAVAEAIPEQAVASRESSAPAPPFRSLPDAEMPNLGEIMKGAEFPHGVPGAETSLASEAPPASEVPAAPLESAVKEDAQPTPAPVADAPAVDTPSADTPADSADKVATGAQEEAAPNPAEPTDAAVATGDKAQPPPTEDEHASAPKAAESKPKLKLNGASAAKPKAEGKKPAPISTPKASLSKTAPLKSPLKSPLPKPITTTKRPITPKLASVASAPKPKSSPAAKPTPKPAPPKETAGAPVHKTSRSSLRQSSGVVAAAPAAVRAKSAAPAPIPESKKPAAVTATASSNTFKKPQAKSPTRPAGLSSRLTKPTAASAAKLGEEKLVRKPSTTMRPPAPAKVAPAVKPSRPSVAPSTVPTKRPESRVSAAPSSEGFLARMTRPTTASAGKFHEKPTSPPRKPAAKTVLQKGKNKVAEVATKAKAAVSNSGSDSPTDDKAGKDSIPADTATESATEQDTEVPQADTDEGSEAKAASPIEEAASPIEEAASPIEEAASPIEETGSPVQEAESTTVEVQTASVEGTVH